MNYYKKTEILQIYENENLNEEKKLDFGNYFCCFCNLKFGSHSKYKGFSEYILISNIEKRFFNKTNESNKDDKLAIYNIKIFFLMDNRSNEKNFKNF